MFKFTIIFFLLSIISCKTQTCDYHHEKKIKHNHQVLIQVEEQPEQYLKICDIPTPEGYQRIEVEDNSFGFYLRNLSLKEDNTVYYYNGEPKHTQSIHYAVIDIDVGNRDLQQCADAVMRLRAEYLYSQKRYTEIHFNFLNDGKPRYYTDYCGADRGYNSFRRYMDYIFNYANSASLNKELKSIDMSEMQIGDVLLRMGNIYGHAIIVVDMAENTQTGEKIFMIAQSYMPAQNIHILKNLNNKKLSPWYSLNFEGYLQTPEWTFTSDDLKRF